MFAASAAAVLATAAPAARAFAPEPAALAPATPFDQRVAAAKQAMMADPQTALSESLAALDAARRETGAARSERIATAQWLQGEALLRLNRLDAARPVIREGLKAVASGSPDSKLHGDLLMAQAGVLATQGQVQPALADFHAAYRIFGKAGEARSQAIALMNIGSIYQDARDYAKVLQYYAQAADLYPGDPSLLVSARNNIGNALREQKRFAEAEAEFERARAIAREMKSALIEAHVMANLAATEVEHGKLDAAQRHVNEALRLANADAAAREALPGVWAVAARLELARNRPQAAAALAERAFAGVDLEKTSLLDRDFHETAYRAYLALGDEPRALAHLRAFKRLDDEARDLAASTNAALMSAQFDYANQASRIARLKASQLQKDVELARARGVITNVLLAGSVVVGVLLLGAFLSIRRSRNEVRDANGKLSKANAALEKAVQARTEFLATTSHEIRTPLNGILGMTQVILADPRLDAELKDKVNLLHGSGETMRALVDDILDLSKIETGKMVIAAAEMDLRKLCEETARLWAEKADAKGVALTLDIDAAPTRIVADAGRLRQILFNLMSNAIKFTHEGAVTLSVRAEPGPDGERLVVAVTDTGIGIPKERHEDVFEPFRQVDGSITRNYEGTGLGLAICRNLARAMGGDIALESTLGKGSTFTVRIALQRAAETRPGVGGAAAESFAEARLLLIDANPLSQAVLRAVVQPQVASVEAVSACADAAGDHFDLVICDGAALGDTADARAGAVARLRRAVAPAAVVVLIAGAEPGESAQLTAAGAAQVIAKPIPAPMLLAALRAGFAERKAPVADSSAQSRLA
ncbi:MAG: tetratricopeptide repeat protein [Phenylobacterium sp.]|uniref:sensor histidine kinase n=1 Tax=Phenylobacterium sp. TaxID=1871053 RepID=UPI001A4A24F8|nr:ATP-binding protein [Phenylobacterium sp.]MBL8773778.1 tetratricopeptide repeat protein [Phenylobacterium sp.]